MSDQSESLGGAWRVLQTAIQFYFQFQMNRRLSGKQNKSEQRRLRQVQNQLYRARSNAAEELFSKQPFQFTGTENDIYYFLPNDRLSLEYVKSIENEELRNKVLEGLKGFEKEELIKYDPRFDDFYVTEEGLNWICDRENIETYKEYMSAYTKHEGVTHMSRPEGVAEGAVQGTTAQASQVGASQAVSSATVATAQTTAQAAGQATAQATAQAAAGAATGGASAAATVAASVAKGIVSSAAQSSAPSPAPTMTMTMK